MYMLSMLKMMRFKNIFVKEFYMSLDLMMVVEIKIMLALMISSES